MKLTTRSEKLKRDPLTTAWRRRFNADLRQPRKKASIADEIASAPIVMVAIDLAEGAAR